MVSQGELDSQEKERSKTQLRFIMFMLSGRSTYKAKETLKGRLIEAFKSCQDIQIESTNDMYNELCGSGSLSSKFKILWEQHKMVILDQLIIQREPYVLEKNLPPSKQLTHVKSAYLVALADDLGLPRKDVALSDRNKPELKLNQKELVEEFKKRINLKEFVKDLCLRVNNKEISDLTIKEWQSYKDNKAFGYYKGENYVGLPEATENQQNYFSPYISFGEVEDVLIEAKILKEVV